VRDHDRRCVAPRPADRCVEADWYLLQSKHIAGAGSRGKRCHSCTFPSSSPSSGTDRGYVRGARLNYVTSPTPFAGTTARQLIPAGHYPFLVRIGTTNEASLALFAGLGFARVKVVPAFGEVEMRFGWVPRGDGCDGEGAFMSGEEMERLARERWTEKGTVIAYD
jgi:hypothetical protein